jgi:nucleoside-diphosphate-sugar epimerase
MVSLNQFARMIMAIAGKTLSIRHVPGPTGVRGRCSDNALIAARLGWAPSMPLEEGLRRTYGWIAAQVAANARDGELRVA